MNLPELDEEDLRWWAALALEPDPMEAPPATQCDHPCDEYFEFFGRCACTAHRQREETPTDARE